MTMLMHPVHPGEILLHEFLIPLDMSAGRLAKRLGVPRTRIERLVKQDTAMTPDTAMRLSRFFGNSVEFWMNLQTNHDVAYARRNIDVSHIEPLHA
ncbi:MAG: HigA family addiction module antitoxin [Pseudomonadota bacterium]